MKTRTERISVGLQGGSSLIVIFGVLCMVVFSVLALSSSLAGARLEKASVDATSAYYSADCKVEENIARLREEGKSGTYTFSCPISETQEIEVTVQITGHDYKILNYTTHYTAPWEADDSLGLWNGQG